MQAATRFREVERPSRLGTQSPLPPSLFPKFSEPPPAHLTAREPAFPVPISFSSIISALSFAIDLTEGAIPGHALRTCILGMRLGREARLSKSEMAALYPALLLKDIGCSSNAARLCEIVGGDDREVKSDLKLQTWTAPREAFNLLWRNVLPAHRRAQRLLRLVRLGLRRGKNTHELISLRCERGAEIARKLGLTEATSEAIQALDERWDGNGFPQRLAGRRIPRLAQILAVAQHLDVFASERGRARALRVLEQRAGTWYDPELVACAQRLDRSGELWSGCLTHNDPDRTRAMVLQLEPELPEDVAAEKIDGICEAFADVVDAKSPFTFRHSLGVAETSHALALALGLSPGRTQLVRRAALLHDLGKLSIPNSILDKPTRITPEERDIINEHPRLTHEILGRIPGFEELAAVAGAHHERLDGTGYPHGLRAESLSLEARIIATADCYQALTEGRPYRESVPHAQAMRILRENTPHALDHACVEALDRAMAPAYQVSQYGAAWVG